MEFTFKNTKFIGFVVVADQRYYLTGSVLEKPEIDELEVGNSAHASIVLVFIAIIVYLQLNKSNDTKLKNN